MKTKTNPESKTPLVMTTWNGDLAAYTGKTTWNGDALHGVLAYQIALLEGASLGQLRWTPISPRQILAAAAQRAANGGAR